ncbi:hypothetical protein BJV74DRAFT_989008 [Russula compacta]|nr:hypothetical protein BJV74DRAFT_989008 [Russula compacta]
MTSHEKSRAAQRSRSKMSSEHVLHQIALTVRRGTRRTCGAETRANDPPPALVPARAPDNIEGGARRSALMSWSSQRATRGMTGTASIPFERICGCETGDARDVCAVGGEDDVVFPALSLLPAQLPPRAGNISSQWEKVLCSEIVGASCFCAHIISMVNVGRSQHGLNLQRRLDAEGRKAMMERAGASCRATFCRNQLLVGRWLGKVGKECVHPYPYISFFDMAFLFSHTPIATQF